MAAKAILRSNKTSIVDTLVADYRLILNKAEENKLITRREYNNLESINKLDDEGHVVELVDKIMNKGEETCQAFLNLLQTDEGIQETYPELKNILKNTEKKRRHEKEPEEGASPEADQPEGSQPVKKPKTRDSQDGKAPWRKSIFDLKSKGILETEAIVGKVVKKSVLLTSKIKTIYFFLGVADKTASVKLMVYGTDHHRQIKEGSSYIFRNLIQEGMYVKVNASSKVSVTKPVNVPEEFEREAESLVYPESPLTSIKDIKSSRPQTHVSVEGTVTQIYPVKKVKVKPQIFKLRQEDEEITVTMWDEATEQSKDLSVGDVVLLDNMKPEVYQGKVSLKSTLLTKITKMDLKALETKWRTVLSSILDELTDEEFRKLLFNLKKIPRGVKEGRLRGDMPSVIIQYYGTKGSIALIDRQMNDLPRLDDPVQRLLRDIKDELKKLRGKNKAVKSKQTDSGAATKKSKPAAEVPGGSGETQIMKQDSTLNLQAPQMDLKALETKWRTVLSSILDELTDEEFRKLLFNLKKIPRGVKEGRLRGDMPSVIIQYYGTKGSIALIDRKMNDLPRLDDPVQRLLRDIKDELKKLRGKNKAVKSKQTDSGAATKKSKPAAEVPGGSGETQIMKQDSTLNLQAPQVFPSELKTEWRTALSSILDELTDFEFMVLLFNLEKIPEEVKEGRLRGDMPSVIIQYYGTEGSITLIDRLMNDLPRLDNAVQQPLREIKELKKLKEDILRDQLIRHVTDVESVLDELFTKGAIHQESYDHICTLPTSEEKMKELLDGHLKSEEDKDILYKIAEKWIPLAEGPRLASQSESVINRGYQNVVLAEVQTVGQVPEVPWITLKPEVICGDDEDTPIYSLESDAGRSECGVSGLRWVCKEKVSLKYQFVSWEEHMERMEALHFIPGGPLLNVTVIAGELEEAYLPHWICTEDNPEVLGKFSVLHIDACGDVVEPVSEVTPSHVKLSQPHFSSIGVLIAKTGLPININCKVLIFKTNMTFLTLHVYLIPKDPDLQQKIKSKKSSGYEMIEKPCPLSLKMGNHFDLNANMDSAEIYPGNLKLEYEGSDPNFYEVFIENPDSNFELTLTHESAPVWTCRIRKDDYTNTGDIQGMRAATSQQTDSGAATKKKKPAADNQPQMRHKMELDKLETKWRTVLSSILDELTEVEFKKLGSSLEKIPQGVKERRLPGDMIHLIIQYYGTEGSITQIDNLMRNLPRLDNKVQQLLRDIKDELKKFQEQNQGSPDEDDMK